VSSLWAYAYQIVPPQPTRRLSAIRTLLKEETVAVLASGRRWSGRLVLERDATHILIVCDAPGRDYAINFRLEAELLRLKAGFTVTEPMPVSPRTEGAEGLATYSGNGR
jgi:hypothetical protein